MPSFIADNLIMEEIAKLLKNAKPGLNNIKLDPVTFTVHSQKEL